MIYDNDVRSDKVPRQTTGPHVDYTFLYQYALGGALAKVRYPSLNWVSYDINGANRISKVRMGETGTSYYMQNAAYNPAGALVGATLGLDGANQWTESRIYNSRLQARRVEVTKGASTLLRLRWAYSGAYNSTTLEETGTDNNGDLRVERLEHLHQGALQTVDRSYFYTGADRLSYFAETGGKNQYFGHDAFGNVWQTSYSGVPSLRQTGSSWYLIGGSTVNNRLSGTTYDNMGNQTQLSVSAGTVASYDGENRMSKIAVGGAEIASYTYDAEGRRVSKTANGTTTYYFYDAVGQLMAEYGGPSQTAATHYFTTDYLGSTRMILGATGGCVERLDYAPFGGQISRGGYDCYGSTSSEKPLYTGQMRDGESAAGTETGQDYFNARYFWANTARFTSPDAPFADQRPEDGQSWNMYAYVRNNPLRYVDPSGERAEVSTTCREEEEGTICDVTIKTSVVIYASQNSNLGKVELAKAADALKKETEAAWAGSFAKDGKTYVVTTSVTTSIADSESAAIKSGADNVVGITRGDAMAGGITSTVQDRLDHPFSRSDRGVFSFEALTAGRNTGAHEMGHFFGGRDLFAGDAIMNRDPDSHSPKMTPVDFMRVLWPVVSRGSGTRTVRAVWSARLGF